jgi:hypothetical protein
LLVVDKLMFLLKKGDYIDVYLRKKALSRFFPQRNIDVVSLLQ